MQLDKIEIAQIKMHGTKPTPLSQKHLYDWVIWQFPKKTANGYFGAVHPPLKKHGWLPAIIHPDKNEVQVYGHLNETFETPELAIEFFATNGEKS